MIFVLYSLRFKVSMDGHFHDIYAYLELLSMSVIMIYSFYVWSSIGTSTAVKIEAVAFSFVNFQLLNLSTMTLSDLWLLCGLICMMTDVRYAGFLSEAAKYHTGSPFLFRVPCLDWTWVNSRIWSWKGYIHWSPYGSHRSWCHIKLF